MLNWWLPEKDFFEINGPISTTPKTAIFLLILGPPDFLKNFVRYDIETLHIYQKDYVLITYMILGLKLKMEALQRPGKLKKLQQISRGRKN